MDIPLVKADKDILEPLLSRVERATGWIVAPKGKRKDREEALVEYIKAIDGNMNLSPLLKAAYKTKARETLEQFCNTNDIVNMAIEQMNENATPEEVDKDWINYFKEYAKNISREDAQILWGKILAEEFNTPGSIPKQLVHILSVMGKKNADIFIKMCGFAVHRIISGAIRDTILIVGTGEKEGTLLDELGITYIELNNLQSLGLIKVNVIDDRIVLEGTEFKDKVLGFEYHGHIIEIHNLVKEIPIGYVSLTTVGEILANMIVRQENPGFYDYIKGYYNSKNFKVIIK